MPITRDANYYDHQRDERKHMPRATDPLPLRFDRPISTAMDLVLCVRAMNNLEDAAWLIEQFIKDKASEQRLDAVAAGARP